MLIQTPFPAGTPASASDEPEIPGEAASTKRRFQPDFVLDLGERLLFGVLFVNFLVTMLPKLGLETGTALLIASESLTGVLIIIRKRGRIATRAYPFLLALIGSAAGWMIHPAGVPLVHPLLAGTLMLFGLAVTVSAKLCLGRSFGVVPANRGVKQLGPYRIVRHPMYFGYLANQLGYLLNCFSIWNCAVYAVAWTMLVLRIIEEEKILCDDPVYRDYAGTVRSRLIPGVF